jgi:hypothetical protein
MRLFEGLVSIVAASGIAAVAAPVPTASTPASQGNIAPAPPTDGKIQILSKRSKFFVNKNTFFCVAQSAYDKNLIKMASNLPIIDDILLHEIEDKLREIGQSPYAKGNGRVGRGGGASGNCREDAKKIIVRPSVSMNTSSKPYRLSLKARQGNGAFVNISIERVDGERPDWMAGQELPLPNPPGVKATPEYTAKINAEMKRLALGVSIQKDANDLAAKFISILFERK